MLRVLVVLFADAFDEICVRHKAPAELHGPWFGIGLGIIDGHVDINTPEVGTRVTFDALERLGSWQASHIEPGLAVLPDRFNDKRISFPVSDRISHPCWLRVARQ